MIAAVVNHTAARKNFDDYTFPSTESEGPKFYTSSESEVRLKGISHFVSYTLKKHNLQKGLEYHIGNFFSFISLIYIIVFVFLLVDEPSKYFLLLSKKLKVLLVVFSSISLVILFLYNVSVKRGLYVKKFENPTLNFINQILAGNFKENPIIYTLCKLAFAVILGVFISAVKEVLKNFLS